MNFQHVLRQLGLLLLVLMLAMGLATLVEAAGPMRGSNAERLSVYALLTGILASGSVGGLLLYLGRNANPDRFNRRDALLLVSLGWILGAALSAVPFYAWAKLGGPPAPVPGQPLFHAFDSYTACYFESMSGLTTTGATVLGATPYDIESLPKGLLLWRALTHWLGGLGIVVLFVAVLPVVGMGGKKMFQIEAPGPKAQGVRPRIKETARILWLIYLALTVGQTAAFMLAGMDWFHALCHTFATLATGGFSTRNASMGAYYDSPWIDTITIVFMLLAGVNFGLYYQLVNRRFSAVYRDPELRLYLTLILVATVIIAFFIYGKSEMITDGTVYTPGTVGALRDSLFQVLSIQTTTGYATVDFNQWTFTPKAVLIVLMFVGGCAGSTGGGCKVIRILIAARVIFAEFERVFRPNVIKPIRIGGTVVDDDTTRSVLIYLLIIVALFAFGAIGLMVLEPSGSIDFTSAATASVATLMNVGPGLNRVGAVENYDFFTPASKMLMAFLMALGRLEVFAILVLLVPRFWLDR